MLIKGWITYGCNYNYDGDLICLQSRFEIGLNMLAISNLNRTIYDCNHFQEGPNMLAIIKILYSQDLFKKS